MHRAGALASALRYTRSHAASRRRRGPSWTCGASGACSPSPAGTARRTPHTSSPGCRACVAS
eukprot:13092020-Alexandrium_andersonii.AAC.1